MVKRKAPRRNQPAVVAESVQHFHGDVMIEEKSPKRSNLLRLPPEILGVIGELIQGQESLQALVATCRIFRDIYSPFLYAELRYNLHKLNPVRPRYIELPPGVAHIKHLSVAVEEFGDERRSGVKYDAKSMNDNYARYLARLIKEIPNLLSFSWYDQSWDAHEIALILKNKTLLKALKAAPKLEKLCVDFETLLGEDDPILIKSSLSLTGFSKLTSLELYNLSGKQVELVEDLSAVLVRSPSLKTLGLGLACHAEWDIFPESMIIPGDCDFLEKLCLSYNAASGEPLSLSTLRLGWGMCVFESKLPEPANFPELLFRPADLRTLHLHNGYVQLGDSESDTQHMPIEWSLLKNCTLLHQVAINRLDTGVTGWLNNTATNLKGLVFADRNGMLHGVAQAYIPSLNHSLSYLFVAEDGYHCHLNQEFDIDSSDSDLTDSSDSSTASDSDSDKSNMDNNPSTSSNSERIDRPSLSMAPGLSTSRATVIKVNDKVATVLDRLKDGGRYLTHLALSIDLEVQWDHFSTRLRTLTDLTHLRLMRRTWRSGPWPRKHNSKWEGVHEPKQIALRYAQLVKSLCPSIRFVRFQEWTWQFSLQSDASKIIVSDDRSQYTAIELEWTEVNKIPIFAKDPIDTQSGLPIDDMCKPYDPDWAKMEATEKIVRERMAEWRAENPHEDWDEFNPFF